MGALEPLAPDEAAWLAGHLDGCAECRRDRDTWLADREQLRTLRDRQPEPPRDLWARTSAAIDQERARRAAGSAQAGARRARPFARMPLGVLAGALAVLVVVAASFQIGGVPFGPNASKAIATPLAVAADRLRYVQGTGDGLYQLVFASVGQVCPDSRAGCAPIQDADRTPLAFTVAPQSVVISPTELQLVVVPSSLAEDAGSVLVVSVPAHIPLATESPAASPEGSPLGSGASASESPSVSAEVSGAPSGSPLASAPPAQAIATGVEVVGDGAYSPDGAWFAFSARPVGAKTGPDLYLWKVGDPAAAAVTTDHGTYFSGWYGDQILLSRVLPRAAGAPPPAASSSSEPAASEPAASEPAASQPASSAPAASEPATSPEAPAAAAPKPTAEEWHPVSFLLDPTTLGTTEFAQPDIWLPAIDANGRFMAYWAGTVVPDASGLGWQPGTGHLVLAGWSLPLAPPAPSAAPSASGATTSPPPASSAEPSSSGPGLSPSTTTAESNPPAPIEASAQPSAAAPSAPASAAPSSPAPSSPAPATIGPTGEAVELVPGPITAFQLSFDPTGTRLAIWIADPENPAVGTIQLLVLDAAVGAIDPSFAPLPGTPAMRGFSMDDGRLAWVSPPGQNGEQSTVHVLAWSSDTFGEVSTIPATSLFMVR
jgi:hypothetical protein